MQIEMTTEQPSTARTPIADESKYTNTKTAAAQLDLTEGRVKHLLKSGDLKGYKPEGSRAWRIEIASVERYARYREVRDTLKKSLLREGTDE